jgi:hypothetical protein
VDNSAQVTSQPSSRYARWSGRGAREATRLCGVLAVLLLGDAPDYRTSPSGRPAFNHALGVCGGLLALLWLAHRLRGQSRALLWNRFADPQSLRTASLQSWWALVGCVSVFALLWLLRAPVHVSALFAIATILAGVCLFCRLAALSLALIRRDRSRPLVALRWLGLVPCSLIGLVVGLLLAGDSWATLICGCMAACLGPLLAGAGHGEPP